MNIVVFLGCVVLLVLGYVWYSRLAEKIYGVNLNKEMPCVSQPDGVDFVPMPMWKIFLIQLLNIAGLGPVVGAVTGCLFGPAALLWIVLGCIFAGAMHDFLSAVMSAERGGANLPELIGTTLGEPMRHLMRVVCIFLLLMVGVVFTLLPAGMLGNVCAGIPVWGWSLLILGYYFLATILPINAIIGRVYPFFGMLFVFMAVGLAVMLPLSGYDLLPNLDVLTNVHPKESPMWPMLFVTIACGAISGFHATQSPMMVRCLPEMRNVRRVFYGAMVAEGMVALVWATVGLTLRDVLLENGQTMVQLTLSNPSVAVYAACRALLGPEGGFIALLGVVVLAVTSGDTAMRSCRLMLADVVRMKQVRVASRLVLAVPLFLTVIVISQLDFGVIWRYFGWANQMLACITLWSICAVLRYRRRSCTIALLPALFMTCMCTTFFLYAPECGICLSLGVSTMVGGLVSCAALVAFVRMVRPGAEILPE